MALANFFDKAALSAGSLLKNANSEAIRTHLLSRVVGIAWDYSAATSPEARSTLDLCVDLLARLYPRISLAPLAADSTNFASGELAGKQHALRERLSNRASGINPLIEIDSKIQGATALLVIGQTPTEPSYVSETSILQQQFYIGSQEWLASISNVDPVGSGQTENPYGAGAAACFGASAVFQAVFRDFLDTDTGTGLSARGDGGTLCFSVVDLKLTRDALAHPAGERTEPPYVSIGETFLVGVGAIGNAVVWALSRTPSLHGTLHFIDPEMVDLTNVQRYVLSHQGAVGRTKVEMATEEMAAVTTTGNDVVALGHPESWAAYLNERANYRLERVLLALDSAEDRIAVQAALPRWIANAWTQPENLGVSRHTFIGDGPCVACLYHPTGPTKNRDQLYAEALGCTTVDELMEVRVLLHSGGPVGRAFIERIAARRSIEPHELFRFENASLDEFYVGALCGGLVFRLGGGLANGRPAEVPMAFQSALAGILLAAELVSDAGGLRAPRLPARSEIDLLRLTVDGNTVAEVNSPAAKLSSGRCLCQDEVFLRAYSEKYALRE